MPKVRHRPGSIEPQEGVTPVQAGLTAGSVAAVAAVLANLPLEAPTDTYFNSAPVMAGALAVGLGAGVSGGRWMVADAVRLSSSFR